MGFARKKCQKIEISVRYLVCISNDREFSHKDGKLYQVALDTIALISPFAFIMENVCEVKCDLETMNDYARGKLMDYNLTVLSGIEPLQHNYPINKCRLLQIGLRKEAASAEALNAALSMLVQNPIPLTTKIVIFLV